MFFTLVFSIPWDFLAVTNHIWSFPEGHNLGFYIIELPLEEYLFMTTVTAFLATMTIVFKYQKRR
jgi:lycopene cyclase domain-containing protein